MPNTLTLRGPQGDMLKSLYDTNKDGIVDDSQQLQNSTKAQVQDHTPKSHMHPQSQVTDLETHLAAKAALSHPHTQSHITDLDHDAQKIKGVIIDDSAKADQKVLAYDLASENIVYIEQAPEGAILNSVQYGSITISAADLTNTATITSVDTSKSLVYFLGFNPNYTAAKWGCARLELLNSTTVIAIRHSGFLPSQTIINFCVIEFINGIASVQQDIVSIPDWSTYWETEITEVDIAKSLIFFLGFTTSRSDSEILKLFPRITLESSTVVRADMDHEPWDLSVGFSVLEFS